MKTVQAVPQVTASDLSELCDRVQLRADTVLQQIDDTEFDRGLEVLEQAARQEIKPSPVIDHLDLLVLV